MSKNMQTLLLLLAALILTAGILARLFVSPKVQPPVVPEQAAPTGQPSAPAVPAGTGTAQPPAAPAPASGQPAAPAQQ